MIQVENKTDVALVMGLCPEPHERDEGVVSLTRLRVNHELNILYQVVFYVEQLLARPYVLQIKCGVDNNRAAPTLILRWHLLAIVRYVIDSLVKVDFVGLLGKLLK